MTGTCIVPKCLSKSKKRRKKGVVLHTFPKNAVHKELWLQFCRKFGIVNINVTHRICSLHFKKDDYFMKPILKEGAVPTMLNKNSILSQNPAATSGSRISLKNLSKVELELHELRTKLEVTQAELEKQLEYKKLMEDSLQRSQWKLLRAQGGIANSNRNKAIMERAAGCEKALHKIFTPKQISFLCTGKRPQQWDSGSIMKGLRLRVATSKRVYKYLREIENLPLPSFPSLSLWVRETFSVRPGRTHSTKLLQMKATTLPLQEKNVVLVFGDTPLNPLPCYDHLDDQVYGPCNQLLLVMIQGLHSDWSQSIYFNFDHQLDHILLHKIINDIECTGLRVRGIVSQVNPDTCQLWTSLGISATNKTCFTATEGSDRNIWVFGDTWQLMMSLRDNLLQNGLTINDKLIFNYEHFVSFFKVLESNGWKQCPKVNWEYIQVTGQGRSQIYLAAQLFSSTVANLLRNIMPTCHDAADFIMIVDSIFDILNTSSKTDDKPQRHFFSNKEGRTEEIISQFQELMSNARFGFPDLLPFQEGFIITLESLKGLFQDLTEENNSKEMLIPTNLLNINCLEDVFSKIRTQTGGYVLPNPAEAKLRIRNLMVEANKIAFTSVTIPGKMTTDDKFNEKIKKNIPEFLDDLLQDPDPGDDDVLLPEKVTDDIDQIYAQLVQEVRTNLTIETPEDFCIPINSMMNMNVNVEYPHQPPTEVYLPAVNHHGDQPNNDNCIVNNNNTLASPLTYSTVSNVSMAAPSVCNVTMATNVVSEIGISNSVEATSLSAPCLSVPDSCMVITPPNKKRKKRESSISEPTWYKKLSTNTVKVSSRWVGKLKMFEDIFNKFHNDHPDHLFRDPKIVTKLFQVLNREESKLDSRLIKRYVRLRTSIRLRYVFKKYTQEQITIHIPY